jgi:hypothetical protein
VGSTPTSYSGDPELNVWPEDRVFKLRIITFLQVNAGMIPVSLKLTGNKDSGTLLTCPCAFQGYK